ncbi:MAG TPA: FAD-binding protein [Reyranella sp.]|nr:FAD-binding protein [Reyranella sp.]
MNSLQTEFDLVIVGLGAAGLAAAVAHIEAREVAHLPVSLLMLESAPPELRGGATRWTTAMLRAMPDLRLDPLYVGKMEEVSKGLADLDYCRAFEKESRETLQFIERHGVELIHLPTDLAQGMEHKVKPNGGGLAIIDKLAAVVERTEGAEILYRHEALRLSLSADGEIDGIVVRGDDGRLKTFNARDVLLACGGFEGNAEMLTRYLGNSACDLKLLAPGLAYNKGAGIRMAQELGAATSGQFDMVHSELVDVRTDRPDAVIYGHPFGILVNQKAQRFFDEGIGTYEETFELAAFEVWKNQKQSAFFIADQTLKRFRAVFRLFDSDREPVEADTLGELAAQLGLDPEALEATVEGFNAAVGSGEFDPRRRDGKATEGIEPPKSNWAYPLVNPPFFAYPLTTAICFTYGGLKTDSRGRVLSESGIVIPGLHAAGEIVGVSYHEYLGATSVFRSLAFGRLVGALTARATDATCVGQPA